MAELYISADLYLFDQKEAEKYNMSVEEYNDNIAAAWNAIVNKEDIVLLMGKISSGNKDETSQLIRSLNGRKKVIDFKPQENNFSKRELFSMGIRDTMCVNGWVRGEINKAAADVIICSTSEYFNNLSTKLEDTTYIATPSSISNINQIYKDKVISLSAKFWNFFPVKYSEIPFLIDNQILFNLMNDEEEEN